MHGSLKSRESRWNTARKGTEGHQVRWNTARETPSTSLLVKIVRGPKDPAAHKGRGPKDPAAQTLNGVVAPFQAPTRLLRQLLVHEQDRRCHVSSHSRQATPLGLAIWTKVHVVTPSGCGCHCATPFLRRVRCRSGSQTLQKRQRLFPYCSLFSTFCVFVHATHLIASPRSPGIGRLRETVKHVTGSPWPLGMGLRSGLTAYFKEEFEAFVFLFLQLSMSSTGSLRRSLQCTPAY